MTHAEHRRCKMGPRSSFAELTGQPDANVASSPEVASSSAHVRELRRAPQTQDRGAQ